MCSFLFSDRDISNLDDINFYNKFRGPDKTNLLKKGGYNFIHNLLSITGDFKIQPFESEDIICLYNGEIYNFKQFGDFDSDGECLIPLYREYGWKFIRELDGEFAICLIDLAKNIAILSSDIFKTKPMFYSLAEGLAASSYSDSLKKLGYNSIHKIQPNSILVIDLLENKILQEEKVYNFDINNQTKDTFEDWLESFSLSIAKRVKNTNKKIFIGLSSGYDSGAICCELLRQKVPFSAYTVVGTEDQVVLDNRFSLLEKNTLRVLDKNPNEISIAHDYIKKNTENFKYVTYSNTSDYNEFWLNLVDDNGSRHLSHVCRYAKMDGNKILLSGMGADEIFSDYGFGGEKKYNHSNFGGLFPEDLSEIFPWPSFFNSSMESYLAKEEYVAGSYGIESRYPFLDKDVVQEFLWLSVKLKNLNYKSVLHAYLNKYNYPFSENKKIGF